MNCLLHIGFRSFMSTNLPICSMHRFIAFCKLVCVVCLFGLGQSVRAQDLQTPDADFSISKSCEEPSCLSMDLSAGNDFDDHIVDYSEVMDDYTINIYLRLSGFFYDQGSEETKEYIATLRSFIDGLLCDHIGQTSIAIAGYDPNHQPIIYTSKGLFVLTSDIFTIGCEDCMTLVNSISGETKPIILTSDEQPLFGTPGISWDEKLNTYQKTSEGCVKIDFASLIEVVVNDFCNYELDRDTEEDIDFSHTFHLETRGPEEPPSGPFFLYLQGGNPAARKVYSYYYGYGACT